MTSQIAITLGLLLGLCAALAIYWRVLRSAASRMAFVGICSMLGLACFSPGGIAWLLVETAAVFFIGQRLRANPRVLYVVAGITLPMTGLVYLKYFQPLVSEWDLFPAIAVPLGISYYTLKHVHYLIECSRGRFEDALFVEYLAFIYFFSMFISGPIERFDRFSEQGRQLKFSWSHISEGTERIAVGVIKKFVVADMFLAAMLPPEGLMDGGAIDLNWTQLMLASFVKFLVIYCDFSGYTDMSLGLARLFGLKLIENFNFPLIRPNLAEFWRSWHISLASWARDYVYFPVLARFRSANLALLATMLTIGVWHGVQPGWLLWGTHHALGLIILSHYHRKTRGIQFVRTLRQSRSGYLVGVASVWWFVSIGHSLTFEPESLSATLTIYLRLISFGMIS